MNARVVALPLPDAAPARVALLGVGTVGRAVWARLAGWQGTPLGERLALDYVANSRVASLAPARVAGDVDTLLARATRAHALEAVEAALGGAGTRIVIDTS